MYVCMYVCMSDAINHLDFKLQRNKQEYTGISYDLKLY
jgi:hypothetical protein